MKNLVKNLVLFVGLTIVLSTFTACPNQTAKSDDQLKNPDSKVADSGEKLIADDSKDNSKAADDKTGKKKPTSGDYPPAPEAIATADIELTSGETFKISEQKDKVVLLNLWAIWCGPCIKEMPHLNELSELYADKGLVVVGINTGNEIGEKETEANIEKFMAKQDLSYKIGHSHRELTTELFRLGQMSGIPQTFLIDREGNLRGIFQGGSMKVIVQMKEVVEKVVNES